MAAMGWTDRITRGGLRQQKPRRTVGRVASVLVFVVTGSFIAISAITAQGTDLRSDRNVTLRDLIREQGVANAELRDDIERARARVTELSGKDVGLGQLQNDLDSAAVHASIHSAEGPGVRVVLNDAPLDVKPAGVKDDDLVVHQQDIQAVVNALWDGGAEAMSIQGQRVIATTGIKCVGNTVVLHGVPYAPPYVIEAIGDQDRMERSLEESRSIQIYRQYVEAYGLEYSQDRRDNIEMPPFAGSLGLNHARRG